MRTFTLGAGADVVNQKVGDSPMSISSGATLATLATSIGSASAGDSIAGIASGDKITLLASNGNALSSLGVSKSTTIASSSSTISDYATTGQDAFIFKDSGKYYLVYETSTSGDTSSFGALEVVELTGLQSDPTISTFTNTGVITFG